MPATDALGKKCLDPREQLPPNTATAPPLAPAEREIVKSYGGWTQFMHAFGLKPWDLEDIDEAKHILVSFTTPDDEE
jgi:hypothetical protein